MEYDSPNQFAEGLDVASKAEPITTHIERLYKRRLGYSFNGPDAAWCQPPSEPEENFHERRMPLHVDPNNSKSEKNVFTGCRKYATCELISDEVRWVPWEKLADRQQEKLKAVSCYRATRQRWNPAAETVEETAWSGWDTDAIQSRRGHGPNANWIGNPFGVRTTSLGHIVRRAREKGLDVTRHRDLSPCPVSGCVTPEMQRDYAWERSFATPSEGAPESTNWAQVEACPFYFRHTTSELSAVVPNLQRFAQCYVMLDRIRDEDKLRLTKSGVRHTLEKAGFIVAAPVFRSLTDKAGVQETFWYSFYSGFSYIQLPIGGFETFDRPELEYAFRWQATSISRQMTSAKAKALSILMLFESVENAKGLLEWERDERVLSISEGYSSWQLLYWVLIQRLKAAVNATSENLEELNIYDELEWEYAKVDENNALLVTLREMGYDIENNFSLKERDGSFYRRASLSDDLYLLGLTDVDGKPTERLNFIINWVHARNRDPRADDPLLVTLQSALKAGLQFFDKCLDPDHSFSIIAYLCLGMLATICHDCIQTPEGGEVESLRELFVTDAAKLRAHIDERESRIESVSRLNPRVHLLVRAYSPVPIRWMFVPMWERLDSPPIANNRVMTKSQSGIILLLKDELTSMAYNPEWTSTKDDTVVARIRLIYPLLDATFRIEEALIRESLVSVKEWWDEQRDQAASMQHYIKDVRNELKRFERVEGFSQVYHLLAYLDSYFRLPPEKEGVEDNSPAAVDVAQAAKEAVVERNAFHEVSGARIKVDFECEEPEAIALITSLDRKYEEEEDVKVIARAQGRMMMFLNDLLIQREAHGARQMVLRVASTPDSISVEVRTPRPFHERFLWDSNLSDISKWPVGRGWYSTFSFARAMGSERQEITNEGGSGLIRIAFRRGER